MNIDDLPGQWKEVNESGGYFPESLEKFKSASGPKNRIYNRLKLELIMQGAMFALLSSWPVFFHFSPPYFSAFYLFLGAILMLSIFYARRFWTFTKKIGDNTLSSKDHLYELYYDIRLVMELYKSWTYMAVTFAIIFGLLHHAALGHDLGKVLTSIDSIIIVISLCLVVPLTEIYINSSFGKYARQVRILLDQLSEI